MKTEDIKSMSQCENYCKGLINDFESGTSSKGEFMSGLRDYTFHLHEMFDKNLNKEQDKVSIRPQKYFVVHDWMVNRFDLFGVNLLTFAFLYNTSRQNLKISEDYISDIFGICERAARYRFKKLFDDGFIKR